MTGGGLFEDAEVSELLRRLDRMPFWLMLLAGVAVGLAMAWGTANLPGGPGLGLAVVVIALAGGLAWSGQPVGIFEEVVTAVEEDELLDMVAIEGGRFLMGSPWWERARTRYERRHRVRLSAFRMSVTTVTRAQYRQVMELEKAPGPGGDDHPITQVSWLEAFEFCNRLSELEELTPCYEIEGDEVAWVEDTGGYRLPTEAEWEYAARAGSNGRWPSTPWRLWSLRRYAWYSANAGGHSHPVATRLPNPWGLYDMHGNVWEWCRDWFAEYPTEPVTDPKGPETPSANRVLRGGAYWGGPRVLRSAYRGGNRPELRNRNIGFRCVRRPRRQP